MPPASAIRPFRATLAIALATLATRIWDFGNPVIHVDEQYYLLVGARMWEGAVPFLDLWDRKPIGLFLLYALATALPGDGILAYQLLAALAAFATASVVHAAAGRIGARDSGALIAALAYLLWLPLLGGRGGQSPVFYNLAIAFGVYQLLVMARLGERRRFGAMLARGLVACLAGGLAIQIKYTAAIEGAFIGLAGLWLLWRAGARPATIAGAALLWTVAGLLPTAAAAGTYAAMGGEALAAFWFANFTSILLRAPYPAHEIAMRLLGIAAQLAPLLACALLGWRMREAKARAELGIVHGWVAAAIGGFLSIGTFFDHYALPLITPLALASATTFGRRPRAAAGTLGLGLLLFAGERAFVRDDAAGAREVAAVVRANANDGCPYVFIGDTITYHLARACVPTAYAFPNMLAYSTEQGALGIDEAGEVRRILRARPPVIVTSTRELAIWNRESLAALKQALRTDYRAVRSVPRSNWRTVIYLRRDLPYRSPTT